MGSLRRSRLSSLSCSGQCQLRCLVDWQRSFEDAVQLPFLCKGSQGGKDLPEQRPDLMPSPSTASMIAGSPTSLLSSSPQSLNGTPSNAQQSSSTIPETLQTAP